MTASLTIAVAQPRVINDQNAEQNVARAVDSTARASAQGADLILFPEAYPGPILRRPRDSYDAAEAMAAAAKESEMAVCWSRVELCDDDKRRLVVYVIGEDGGTILRYERTHPAAIPPEQTDGVWYAPGDTLGQCQVKGVDIGIAVCSELWPPEVARCLAIGGAEVILSPAGGSFTSLTDNWQTIARARAIENLAYVVLTNSIWGDETGAAMVAGPEGVIASSGHEELFQATVDLDRLRWLRENDDSIEEPKPFASIPGLVRFRRPELYGLLTTESSDTFDFHTDRSPASD